LVELRREIGEINRNILKYAEIRGINRNKLKYLEILEIQ
jgi:hypothetical protein